MRDGDVATETKHYAADFKDGRREHEPRNAGSVSKWKRQENRFSPKGTSPTYILTLIQ